MRTIYPGCVCGRCARQRLRVRRAKDHGIYVRVSPEEAQAALDKMIADGMDGYAVSTAVGVPRSTANWWVRQRRRGKPILFGPVTARQLVNAGPPTAGHIGGFAPILATRMLRALACMGYGVNSLGRTMEEEGIAVGNPRSILFNFRDGRRPVIDIELLEAIKTLYRRYEMTPAPANRYTNHTRVIAQGHRWAPPLAWDNIEDPDDTPQGAHQRGQDKSRNKGSVDTVTVDRAILGDRTVRLTAGEKALVVQRMQASGVSFDKITKRTGITKPERYTEQEEAS
jgi:hypothetical protein